MVTVIVPLLGPVAWSQEQDPLVPAVCTEDWGDGRRMTWALRPADADRNCLDVGCKCQALFFYFERGKRNPRYPSSDLAKCQILPWQHLPSR